MLPAQFLFCRRAFQSCVSRASPLVIILELLRPFLVSISWQTELPALGTIYASAQVYLLPPGRSLPLTERGCFLGFLRSAECRIQAGAVLLLSQHRKRTKISRFLPVSYERPRLRLRLPDGQERIREASLPLKP